MYIIFNLRILVLLFICLILCGGCWAQSTSYIEPGQSITVRVTDQQGEAINWFYQDRTSSILPPNFLWEHELRGLIRPTIEWTTEQIEGTSYLVPSHPQKHQVFKKVSPSIKITIKNLNTGETIYRTLLSGEEELTVPVMPGLYYVEANTTIQVDRIGPWDTYIKAKNSFLNIDTGSRQDLTPQKNPSSKDLTDQAIKDGLDLPPSKFPDLPIGGRDKSVSWECFGINDIVVGTKCQEEGMGKTMPGCSQQYMYELFKRFTYNVSSSTLTNVNEGESDTAYICLVTEPTLLDSMINSASPVRSEEQQLAQDAAETVLVSSSEELLKKVGLKAYGYVPTAGLNIIKLGYDPNYHGKVGIAKAVSSVPSYCLITYTSTIIGSSLGGPVGGLITGVVLSMIADQEIEAFLEDALINKPLRINLAKALFDDIQLRTSEKEGSEGEYLVEVLNAGIPVDKVVLQKCTSIDREMGKSAITKIAGPTALIGPGHTENLGIISNKDIMDYMQIMSNKDARDDQDIIYRLACEGEIFSGYKKMTNLICNLELLEGEVRDPQGVPIEGAAVITDLNGMKSYAWTSKKGEFLTLNMQPQMASDQYILEVSKDGFRSFRDEMNCRSFAQAILEPEIRNDLLSISNGITKICPWGVGGAEGHGVPGVPGPIEAFSKNAIPIVSGDDDTTPSNAAIAIASTHGAGRIVALGHDGFFINSAMDLFDNKLFGNNIIDWLNGKDGSKKVLVTTGHGEPWVGTSEYDSFFAEVENRGYTVTKSSEPITPQLLSDVGVLFISIAWKDVSDSEIAAISDYVSNGGGLYLAGLGWAWKQYNDPNLYTYPMNKIGSPFGIRWIDGYISDSTNNHEGAPLFHTFYTLK